MDNTQYDERALKALDDALVLYQKKIDDGTICAAEMVAMLKTMELRDTRALMVKKTPDTVVTDDLTFTDDDEPEGRVISMPGR